MISLSRAQVQKKRIESIIFLWLCGAWNREACDFYFYRSYKLYLHGKLYFQLLILQYFIMTNNKMIKQFISFGTQFTSKDIFEESEPMESQAKFKNGGEKQIKVDHSLFAQKQLYKGEFALEPQDTKISPHHNFQKHAVITIKNLMKMNYNAQASDEQKLAFKMWNIFMVSGIKTKKILVILFGAANLQDSRNRHLFTKCGFEEILTENDVTIRRAQQVLRNRFLETVSEDLIRQNIENFRKIEKTQEFLLYFSQLLNALRKGPFTKLRMDNYSTKSIQAQLKNGRAPNEMINLLL